MWAVKEIQEARMIPESLARLSGVRGVLKRVNKGSVTGWMWAVRDIQEARTIPESLAR